MKRVLIITAGGTAEPIDGVRSITNTGTGRLGSLIAQEAAAQTLFDDIIYVHGPGAVLPEAPGIKTVPITSTQDLLEEMTRLCRENAPAAVIHSMAVSDYCVRAVLSAEELLSCPADSAEELLRALEERDIRSRYHKLPSNLTSPLLLLQPTPKVLSSLRGLAPQAILVGFKLLDTVPHEVLMETAARLMHKNDCDFVLANDYHSIRQGCHEGYLMDRSGHEEHLIGKEGIAKGIIRTIKEKLS